MPTPTGTVQFEVDGAAVGTPVALAGGAATSAGITLTAGSHTITAVYLGDATYAGALASLTVTAVVPTATVEVTASSPLTIAGQHADVHGRGHALRVGRSHADGDGPVRGRWQ